MENELIDGNLGVVYILGWASPRGSPSFGGKCRSFERFDAMQVDLFWRQVREEVKASEEEWRRHCAQLWEGGY